MKIRIECGYAFVRAYGFILFALALVVGCFVAQAMIGAAPSDSSLFRYIGWRMSCGAQCFEDIWDHKGPLIFLLNAIGYVTGIGAGSVYFLVWIVAVIGVFLLGRRYSLLIGSLSAAVFAVAGLGFAAGVFLDNVELTAAIFMVAAALLFLREPNWWTHMAVGVCIGGAFLTKPNLISGGVAMVVFCGLQALRDHNLKTFVMFGFWSGLGFMIALVGMTIVFAAHGTGWAMWDAMLFFNAFEYASHGTDTWAMWWLGYLRHSVFSMSPGWWMIPSYLTMLVVGLLGASVVRGRGGFLMVWALLETFAAFMAKQFYGHYLLMPLVPLSVLVAISCVQTGRIMRTLSRLLVIGGAGLFLVAIWTGIHSAIARRSLIESSARAVAEVIPPGKEVACFVREGGAEMMLRDKIWSRQKYQFGVNFWRYMKPKRQLQVADDLLKALCSTNIEHFIFEGGPSAIDYFSNCPELVTELKNWHKVADTDFVDVYIRHQ